MAHFIWAILLTSALTLFFPHTVHSFQCYQCMNATSFEQCSKSATIVNCEDQDQEVSQLTTNVSYACAKVNMEILGIQTFIKSCTRNFPEATICTTLAEQTEGKLPGAKVNVCKVCYSELCNASSVKTFDAVFMAICSITLITIRRAV